MFSQNGLKQYEYMDALIGLRPFQRPVQLDRVDWDINYIILGFASVSKLKVHWVVILDMLLHVV